MERFYRNWHSGKLNHFVVQVEETDLWIEIDRFEPQIKEAVYKLVKKLREDLKRYIKHHSNFLTSLEPVQVEQNAPEIVLEMAQAGNLAKVGPMAAVAGAVADKVGKFLSEEFNCKEVIVENGGDIYLKSQNEVIVGIYAGKSPLSGKVGLKIPPGEWGICTSSGTVGHSLSFGKADAVTIVSENATIADAFATYYCNMVKDKKDVEKVLEIVDKNYVKTIVVIIEDKLGIVGEHELVILEGSEA
ncbi:UPF0280 family protein [Pseudothermotoga thermarum]|uniref:ApbE family lipoprotein n=1 Tax=Pseudothermotoga thermarum DSM 5069 TaxID=688269 RepID=F7YXH6_9THEM|nr:UPF0280 family protein [Pseudothermotoga thermarum]AEH50617.1 ApbE family lipoprotein [Pseudothermotoga thermarum DSM 5069]